MSAAIRSQNFLRETLFERMGSGFGEMESKKLAVNIDIYPLPHRKPEKEF
jgi:hypothetical protein